MYKAKVVVTIACMLEGKLLPGHLLYVSVFSDLAGLLVPTEWRSLKEVGRKKKAVAEHQSIHCYQEKPLIPCALGREEALHVLKAFNIQLSGLK